MPTSSDSRSPRILPLCYQVAQSANVLGICDGAANVGQIAHAVGVSLTNVDKARISRTTAVPAAPKPHLEIAENAKKNIVINGCGNRCASKVLQNARRKIDYEMDTSKYLKKVPTLDVYQADVKKIAG